MNRPQVIILGAGKPFSGERPSALVRSTNHHRRALDWVIDAFSAIGQTEFHFVGGYRLEDIVAQYPNIFFSINGAWRTSRAAGSLLAAPLDADREAYVCYSDTVFSPEIVADLASSSADLCICVDRNWRDRYEGRSESDLATAEKITFGPDGAVSIGSSIPPAAADGELVGVFRFSPRAIARFKAIGESGLHADFTRLDMPALINLLKDDGLTLEVRENRGRWAELNAPQDLARFVLGTKGETLERLRPLVRKSRIGEQVRFTAGDWKAEPRSVIGAIQDKFPHCSIIVRSSAHSEDGWAASNAGGYESVLHVSASSASEITKAVERVIASYGSSSARDQVLVQEMLQGVALSGVAFTRTLSHGAPYYVINYDDSTRRTDSVTSGSDQILRTVFVRRKRAESVERLDPRIARVIEALAELEGLVGHTSLDVEFAMDTAGLVHVLQLRPIAVRPGQARISDESMEAALTAAETWFDGALNRGSRLLGARPVFGIMSDWNPAEIVGSKPRKLALSLYRHLITDEIWATQRAEYGYRDVRPCPLIVNFAGHPYVDIRASFNSFIPAGLPDALAAKLADHYLDRLVARPELHDKVEFDVAFTCFSFDFDERARDQLRPAGFSDRETGMLRDSLVALTREGIARIDRDYAILETLEQRYLAVVSQPMQPADRAFELLEDCKRFGTLTFAHLARGGFVAMSLLRSLERTGVITPDESNSFMASLATVTRRFETDGGRVHAGDLPFAAFVERYGHLRPGTYEITSARYSEDPERYLRPMIKPVDAEPQPFVWPHGARQEISRLLAEAGLGIDLDGLDRFLRRSIEGREYAKFLFTRNLSAALSALSQSVALDREALSHVDISDLLKLRVGGHPPDVDAWLSGRAEEGAAEYELTRAIELPPLLTCREEFAGFERPATTPNFVGQGLITGDVVVMADGEAQASVPLKGKIVVIPRADPGYDWLFAHKIGGLITQYGGANSHMAIRSAELGLPAAIGVGEALFEKLSGARTIVLDCAVRKIDIQA